MYHYCGIQVRPGSTQNQQPSAIYQQPSLHKRYNLRSCSSGSMSCGILDEHYQQNTSHSASSDHVNSLQQVHDLAQFQFLRGDRKLTKYCVCLSRINMLRTYTVAITNFDVQYRTSYLVSLNGRGYEPGCSWNWKVGDSGLPASHFKWCIILLISSVAF
jgi:hypothetical protein